MSEYIKERDLGEGQANNERRSGDDKSGKSSMPGKSNTSGKYMKSGKIDRTRKQTKSGKNIRFKKRFESEKRSRPIRDISQLISRFWNLITERIPRPLLITGIIIVVALIGIAFSMGGRSNTEAAEVSAGQKDNINGFMFIFDRRSAQQRLVEDMKKGAVPLKLTCEKIELIYGDDGTVSESIDESATIVTDDSDFITQVYQEMTDMIVIGQTAMRDNTTRCRITMVLQDGTDCIFNFDTVSIIEIEGQDYMMESDGGLWKLLPGFF